MLAGSEVKSVRLGKLNLKDAYCKVIHGELFLVGAHISAYEKGSHFNPDERRIRKLLLHRQEIDKLRGKIEQKGLTLVPTKAYFSQGLLKIEVGLARGKELHDKRKTIKDRDIARDTERQLSKL
jgi:SsrA-binding protein